VKVAIGVILAALFALPFAAAGLEIAPWYPQGNSYVFLCSIPDTSYDWDFGDGEKLYDIAESSVYHTFESPGTYEVYCEAGGERHLLRVKVGTEELVPPVDGASAKVSIAPWYPQENRYVFICEEDGFEATSYDWDFGDGHKIYDLPFDNVFHEFSSEGDYLVSCTASDGLTRVGASTLIVGGIPEVPTELSDVELSVAPWFPQGLDVVFNCDAGFDAEEYLFEFGDGSSLKVDFDNVYHTFPASGGYEVTCTAKKGEMVGKDSLFVEV